MSTSSSIPSARFWLGRRLLAEAAQNAHLITDNWLAELVRGLLEQQEIQPDQFAILNDLVVQLRSTPGYRPPVLLRPRPTARPINDPTAAAKGAGSMSAPDMSTSGRRMTKAEQSNLLRLAKLNRDGAIMATKRRTSEGLAEFDMRLAADFAYDQRAIWAELIASAKAHVAALDRQLADDCERLGIPAAFRPSISVGWYGRGENASKERRTELRRAAVSRLVGLERGAIEEIETGYRKFSTAVISAAIGTDEARQLLSKLPTAGQLLPAIDYREVTRALLEGPEAGALRSGTPLLPDDSDGEIEP